MAPSTEAAQSHSGLQSVPFDVAAVGLMVAGTAAVLVPVVAHHRDGLLHEGRPHHGAVEDHILRGGGGAEWGVWG